MIPLSAIPIDVTPTESYLIISLFTCTYPLEVVIPSNVANLLVFAAPTTMKLSVKPSSAVRGAGSVVGETFDIST